FPRFSKTKDLRQLGGGYYRLVLAHLRSVWGPEFIVLPDVQVPQNNNEISLSANVESFSHVWVRKSRFGAGEEHRGQSAKYAYIDGRIPVQIGHLFRVQHEISEDRKISAAFAFVKRFQPCTVITDWPWDLWATDIGIRVWNQNCFDLPEVVALERLTGHFVLAPVTVRGYALWITIAFDH
ncbi:hypothetical protein C8F04DRAFT_881243, partial [Mycena alexandri]